MSLMTIFNILMVLISLNSNAESVKEIFRSSISEDSKLEYVVRLTRCQMEKISGQDQNECQLEIILRDAKKIISAYKFGAKMTDFKLPPKKESNDTEYSSGEGEAGTELKVREIQLDNKLKGLLVTQVTGFEHVHREHFVFAAIKNKMVKAWSANEGAGGPVTSEVAILSSDDNIDGLLYQKQFFMSDSKNGIADEWTIKYYQWNSLKMKLEETKNKISVWAMVVGTFKEFEGAIDFKFEKLKCLKNYFVLETSKYKKLEKAYYIVGLLFTDKKKAEEALAKAYACDGKLAGYIKRAL